MSGKTSLVCKADTLAEDADGGEPDVVVTGCGDIPTREALALLTEETLFSQQRGWRA